MCNDIYFNIYINVIYICFPNIVIRRNILLNLNIIYLLVMLLNVCAAEFMTCTDTQYVINAFTDTQYVINAFTDTQYVINAFTDTQYVINAFTDTQYL